MVVLNIYLFRHGQTTFNRDKRFTGWLNPQLTSLGKKQAKFLAKKLKREKIDVAFCTRLRRSKETLNEVLKFHPECKKIIVDDRMIERNYGELNGMRHEDFIKKVGKSLFKLGVEDSCSLNFSIDDRKKIERFLGEEEFKLVHRGFYVSPPGGESFAMVEKRVKSFINSLLKLMRKEKVNVAISAHGNSIRIFRKIMENASIEESTKWNIPYHRIFVYKIKV